MSRSWFFNKILDRNIFRGTTSKSLVMVIFRWMPIATIYCYCSLGGILPWPHPCRPLAEIRDRFKGKNYFLEITMFLEKKIHEIRKDLVINFLFHYSMKCRFNQMSFRSSIASIKCRLIKCRSINCRVTGKKYVLGQG